MHNFTDFTDALDVYRDAIVILERAKNINCVTEAIRENERIAHINVLKAHLKAYPKLILVENKMGKDIVI